MPAPTTRRGFVRALAGAAAAAPAGSALGAAPNAFGVPAPPPAPAPDGAADRAYWVALADRLAAPVLGNLARRRLRAAMPVELSPAGTPAQRGYTHLEATGRLLAGLAPWLEAALPPGPERDLQARHADLARRGLDAATDPRSPDFLNFTEGRQPVVDAAFLGHAILRAPHALWARLDPAARRNVAAALRSTRVIRTSPNNHLLFSAMVEAALCRVGEEWDAMRVDYALRQHEQWYKGDGVYGDGSEFHWDYYNSFVIHPMLLDVLRVVTEFAPQSDRTRGWADLARAELPRARRYAAVQERLISPEGTFPPVGRSLAYRSGAFQLLAQVALARQLPEGVAPAQVRSALTAVMRRQFEAPGTFDANGWLTIGFCGHQPSLGEGYISTGSLYLCSASLLALGLPPADPFWRDPPAPWTAQKIWGGRDAPADHAL